MEPTTITAIGPAAIETIIDEIAESMTYERTMDFIVSIAEASKTGDDNTPLDRILWSVRWAYIIGSHIAFKAYDEAISGGDPDPAKLTVPYNEMTDEEYSAAIRRVYEFLKMDGRRENPKPRRVYEGKMNRITQRLEDGQLDVALDNEQWPNPYEKLEAYEDSGFEPQDLPFAGDRPYFDILSALDPDESADVVDILTRIQKIVNREYELGYAKGCKDKREMEVLP